MTIFLIGSMGVGKSAIGKRLSKSLGIDFYDTDDLIIAKEGMSINDIFKNKGESYFRELESGLITEIDYTKTQIFATGGGLPITKGNLDYMKRHAIIIYLEDNIESILSKVVKGKYKRPAIRDLDIQEIRDKLTDMLDQRTPIYRKAHLTFKRSTSLEEDVNQLSTYIKMMLF